MKAHTNSGYYKWRTLIRLNDFYYDHEWNKLNKLLDYFCDSLSSQYLDYHWKFILALTKNHLENRSKPITFFSQLLDFLISLRPSLKDELIYSMIYIFFSQNEFELGKELFDLYDIHLMSTLKSARDDHLVRLIESLRANMAYLQWKKSIPVKSVKNEMIISQSSKRSAEACASRIEKILLANSKYECDIHLQQLLDIYTYFNELNYIEELIVTKYASSSSNSENPSALRALLDVQFNQRKNDSALATLQRITKLSPFDSYVLKYMSLIDDVVTSIDCMFDILEFYKWKFDPQCWSMLHQLLTNCLKTDSTKECILENWRLRMSYWMGYHFRSFTSAHVPIDDLRLRVGLVLLGSRHPFVKTLAQHYNINMKSLKKEKDRNDWLFRETSLSESLDAKRARFCVDN